MLRLNVSCSFIPRAGRHLHLRYTYGSCFLKCPKDRKLPDQLVVVRALQDNRDGGGSSSSSSPGRTWDPSMEIQVPFEQRPVNEYSSLKDSVLYSWGDLGPGPFFLRLGGLWLVTFSVLGVPVAAASFNPSREPLKFAVAAGTGTLFLVALIVLRIYLGWSYVGDRLLSAVIPYEESGWYDGQMWVKPPEVQISPPELPVIKLLKQTLVGIGVCLVAGVGLFIFSTPVEDFLKGVVFTQETASMVPSKTNAKFNIRKEELLRLPVEVMADDDLAAAAAEAADGRPVYISSHLLRFVLCGLQPEKHPFQFKQISY